MCHRLIPYYRQLETKHRNEEKKEQQIETYPIVKLPLSLPRKQAHSHEKQRELGSELRTYICRVNLNILDVLYRD